MKGTKAKYRYVIATAGDRRGCTDAGQVHGGDIVFSIDVFSNDINDSAKLRIVLDTNAMKCEEAINQRVNIAGGVQQNRRLV